MKGFYLFILVSQRLQGPVYQGPVYKVCIKKTFSVFDHSS